MAIFGLEFNNLNDLFINQLEDLYDAEQRITEALPQMSQAAHSSQLKEAFDSHLQETRGHVRRLERVFQQLGMEPKRETCQAMKGLISEGSQIVKAKGDENVRDAGLIAAAQRVEHYEMAGYGTVRSLAHQLGLDDVAGILQQTLDEEGAADKKLTEIAENSVNVHA